MKINFSNSKSKVQAIIDAVASAIMRDKLCDGDNLLSINEASKTYKVSRDTVFKAYSELKRRGLIDSNPMKGYFVKIEMNHVLLLLDTYSPFKQNLYNRFVAHLPQNYKVDLIFHQYNERLFETIIRESAGRYNMHVVMNFSNTQFSESLKSIPASKLLLLDFGAFEKSDYAYICQDFDQNFYNALLELEHLFRKYKRLELVFPPKTSHPISTITHFIRFCTDMGMAYKVYGQENEWKEVERNTVYICFQTEDMVKIIRNANAKSLEIGTDIGIIAYNEDPILEVIKNGITSISVDFGEMGELAADYVLHRNFIQEYLPTKVCLRHSV